MDPAQEVVFSLSRTERRKRIELGLIAVAAAINQDDYDTARKEWSFLRIDLEARRSRAARSTRERLERDGTQA